MKKIYALFMTLCLVISATAGPLVGTVKGSYPLDTKVVTSAKQLSLDASIKKAPAATQGMQYDATEGELIRYYNESDNLAINADYLSDGQLSIRIGASDNSDLLSLVLWVQDTVLGTIVPEGTYPITSEPAYGTAYASPGIQNGSVYPSFYGMLNSKGQILTPLYFLESGNVVVEVVDGNLKISIDAANSNNVPMTIVYEVGGKSEKVEVKGPLKYDATETDGALDVTYGADATVELTNGNGYSILTVASPDATNEVDLAFFYDAVDPETVIPAGTYTIDDSYTSGTVLASSGVNSQGQVTLSFYANLNASGQLVTPLYFLVSGTVEVTKVDGKLKVEVNGLNSNGVAVHVVYDATPADDPVVELPAASVRAWAYDLALAVEGEQYTFSYKATTAAKATLIFSDAEGVELATKDLGLVEAGANTAVLAASELPEAAEINWAIKLEAGAIAEVAEVTDQTRGIYDFYNMMDVLVDNNPESEYFGRIYIQMAYDGADDAATDRSAVQKAGFYLYDQALNELNPESNVSIRPTLPEGYTMGDNRNKFHRLDIEPKTGNLTWCYNVANQPAVFAVDAANLAGEATNLVAGIEGISRTAAHCFDAEGALYVMDLPSAGTIYKIVNGVATVFAATDSKWVNASMTLAADGKGGLWVAQNRGQIDTYYQLAHYTKDGVLDYAVYKGSENGFTGSSARGALAYNAERQLLAQGRNGKVEVYSVAYDAETGVPALTLVATTPTVGSNIDGLHFDYAGDLYVVNSSKEKFQKFAMPTENNACTTPAASKYAIKLVEEYIVKATVNPAETGVITGLAEGGVYVKGAEATLTATAAEGYEFVNWTVADSVVSTEATYTFVVEANVELVANFKEKVKAIEVNVTDATATSGEWSIDLAGSWNDQALTIKLWQDNTQGFGSYAPNTETGYYILLGAKELTPTTEGVYADNGDGTFTFTCSATEGTTQYNITVTGTSGAQEVYYETYELTNLVVTDNETFLVLSASDMNIGLAVMLGVNMDRTLMDASQILFGEEELPILSSEPVTVTFNEELQTEVYTARVVVEHMGQQLGLELIMYAGGATSEPIAVNVIGATAAVDEATDVLKITGDWDGIAFELRINAYDPAQTLYDAPQIAEFETEEVYATSSLVTVIKTGENIDVIGEFMSPMGDIYNVYVNAIFAAGPETGVDNIQVENTTVKVVEDGQVFIIRNGVKFNANGAVVK